MTQWVLDHICSGVDYLDAYTPQDIQGCHQVLDVSLCGKRVSVAVGLGPACVGSPSLGELEGGGTPKKGQRNLLCTIHSSSGPRSWLSLQVATCPASLAAEPGSGHVPGLDTRQGVSAGSSWVSLSKVSEDDHELSPQQA